jgi:hypothetical protein
MDKLRELIEEFRSVVTGRGNLLDSIVPPLIFLIVNALLGFQAALWGSLIVGAAITILRLIRGQSPLYALGGIAGATVAVLLSWFLGSEEGYFLPGIVGTAFTAILCLVSILAGQPLVAWSSHLVRRWPRDWYWYPRVRPAYTEVTLFWLIFFAGRLILQIVLYRQEAVGLLAILNAISGWPTTIVLLIVSYLYGTWRLRNLGGPSVEEFQAGEEPPWESQRRGF